MKQYKKSPDSTPFDLGQTDYVYISIHSQTLPLYTFSGIQWRVGVVTTPRFEGTLRVRRKIHPNLPFPPATRNSDACCANDDGYFSSCVGYHVRSLRWLPNMCMYNSIPYSTPRLRRLNVHCRAPGYMWHTRLLLL